MHVTLIGQKWCICCTAHGIAAYPHGRCRENMCLGSVGSGPNNVLLSDLSFPISAAIRCGAAEEVEFRPTFRMREFQVRAHTHRRSSGTQGRRLVPPRRARRTFELRDAPCSVFDYRAGIVQSGGQWLKFFSKRLRMRLNKLAMRPLTGSCINKTFRQSYPQLAKRPIPSSVRANGRRRKMPAQCAT